jgi:hypothetical protein
MQSLIVADYGDLKKALKDIPPFIKDVICLTNNAVQGYTCVSSNTNLADAINMGLRLVAGDQVMVVDSRVCHRRVIEGLFGSMERYDGLLSLGHTTGFGLVHGFGAHVINRDCFYGVGYLDSSLDEDVWTDWALRSYLLGFMPKMQLFDLAKTKYVGISSMWNTKWPDWPIKILEDHDYLLSQRHIIIERLADKELYVPYCEGFN